MRKLVLVVLALSLIGGSCPALPNLVFVPLAQTALSPIAFTIGSILADFIDQTLSPVLGLDTGG